ncbi:hypothetical protein PV10_03277 [Exophiala mesophila]|uniref:Peroxisomal ATPase PEX6 n=1 Tax=Exophiala mesophila TaxID=212818 RepID=A0A0D1Y4R4_EXOME|nr:uncharacterized protein PV10_03277 [Exophiala mesophila]KIV95651.1 hypothetical protein PV10_03277 [Exophiala mesophila]
MDQLDHNLEHPKKRRRREIALRPLTARLLFDETIKGDAAVFAHGLWDRIGLSDAHKDLHSDQDQVYVAITPRSALHLEIQDSTWTILTAVPHTSPTSSVDPPEQADTIRISPSAAACQSLLRTYSNVERDRHPGHIPKSIEVRFVCTKPLALETIYVSVEKGLLDRVDDIQSRFGGGFQSIKSPRFDKRPSLPNGSLQNIPAAVNRLTALVRDGLSHLPIVHSGDVFPLPLPAHPITHARSPPAIVIECEPVSQGRITAQTKVILIQTGSSQEKALKKLAPVQPIIEESLEDTAEDTSNDQFYSAAEDGNIETGSDGDDHSDADSESDESAPSDSDEDSDSMDDMISLSAPGLPPQQAGTLSAMTAATPRPGGKRATGTHTPGSLYSSFSSATARNGGRPGKVFRTQPLLQKVPIDLLHPRPSLEDDDQSFVFIDTSTLAKIGCFSGDWVRIEVSKNVSAQGFSALAIRNLSGFGEDEDSDWRAVRVFGLSGLTNQGPRYAVDKTGDRRTSFSQRDLMTPMSPVLLISPLLLANLDNAQYVKLGALPSPPRPEPKSLHLPRNNILKTPPFAKEVVLSKIADPVTTNPALQSTLFSALKSYLESKKRALKKGDLLALSIDQELGKAVASQGPAEERGDDEAVTKLNVPNPRDAHRFVTAWFSVQQVDVDISVDRDADQNPWGGVAILDSTQARVSQSGSSIQPISHSTKLWTQYWSGTKKPPQQQVGRPDHIATASDLPALSKLPAEKKLSGLIEAAVSNRAISLGLPPLAILLYSTQRQIGKSYIATSACSTVGVHTFAISAHDLLSENASTTGGGDVKTEALLKTRAERALSGGAQQTALMIQHVDALTADRMIPVLQEIISSSRVFFATTTKLDDIPAGLRSLFSHELEISAPDEKARELILANACVSASIPLSPSINLKSVALQTAALVAGDLVDVINRASLARIERLESLAESQSCQLSDIYVSGGPPATHLLPTDINQAIAAARSTFSDAIGAPKIPTVTWQDVGGLSSQKDAIMETISLPLTHPELFANGIRKRSGILFYGPPGTGKTLLAKAIATEFSLNFFSVKGPELLNMYIGESEANVRRVFQRARDARPCVVFFDELDSVAPKRGNQGDSGGVMDRIVSQLLAELDGMSGGGSGESSDGSASNGGGVFVIGATNRPDLLDPALLRPGRFDKMLYLGVADSHDQQLTILKALTRKFTLASDVDLNRVASRLPFTYTGADLYALCSDAMLKAITRKTRSVDEKVQAISKARGEEISTGYFFDHLATEEDIQVVVAEEDFTAAQTELVGSVSKKELEHFERIRGLFEEQDITATETKSRSPTNANNIDAGVTFNKAEAKLPIRPPPPIPTSSPLSSPATLEDSTAPSVPSRAPTRPLPSSRQNSSSHSLHSKGKGKARAGSPTVSTPVSNHFKQPTRIGNPDSGASSDGDDDYGVSMHQLNGTAVNGVGSEKLKGKGKANATAPVHAHTEPVIDGFVDDVEGDDEGLYDD